MSIILTGLVLYSDGMSSLVVEWNDNGNDGNIIPKQRSYLPM